MKPWSIKTKITVWYTGLIVFILCIILGALILGTDKILILEMQRELEDEVFDAVEEIHYTNGAFDFQSSKFFDDGIYISVYNQAQQQVGGLLPAGFPAGVPLQAGKIQTLQSAASPWLLYDLYLTANWPEPLWLRGAISLGPSYETRKQILLICVLLFPFLILLAACGGWFITKTAFLPVSLIQRTAMEIENGGDLSKRIRLTGSRDEIYELAQTFDHMLAQLEQSFKTQCRFTADASHELRTPVSVILAHAEYGLSQQDKPEEMLEALQVIQRQAHKMGTLISSLLFLARADHQSAKLDFEPVNLSETAEMVLEEMRPFAEAKHIAIRAEITPDLIIVADQTAMLRLLLNLLQNSIRYGRDNGWIKLRLSRAGSSITGSIEDNGIGIAPEDLGKIWNRFYQADPARKRTADSGSGLGLPIVKWIIEQHNGQITVSSRPGQGTVFHFRLPARPDASQ